MDVAIQQLAAIQKSIDFLINQVAQLREDLFKAIGEQYAYELHNEVVAAIGKVHDIRLEADMRGVSLAADNPDRKEFPARLLAAYENFDNSRRKLWALPHGTSTVCSSVCSTLLAVDSIAYACGIASEERMAINLKGHLAWLDRMIDPKQQYSVAAALAEAQTNEASIVDKVKRDAAKRDAVSIIVDRLYSSASADLCVVYKMDALVFLEDNYKTWTRTGVTTSVLVATFSRDEVDKAGAKFLTNVKDLAHSVVHSKPTEPPLLAIRRRRK